MTRRGRLQCLLALALACRLFLWHRHGAEHDHSAKQQRNCQDGFPAKLSLKSFHSANNTVR